MSGLTFRKKPAITLAFIGALLLCAFLLHVLSSRDYSTREILHELRTRGTGTTLNLLVWNLRVPRACSCVVVGAILGMVGSAFQALFRNPLAEPYIVGVSSGSAVGGALALVTGFGAAWTGIFSGLGMTVLAFPAGLISLGLVLLFARRRGIVDVQTLLLAGVVTGSMLSAVLSFILLYGGQDTSQILRWLLGSMSLAFWPQVDLMCGFLIVGAAVLIAYSKQLNAFALGEGTAQHLGVNVRKLKPVILITGTAMVAATVGSVGIIGFLGLVAPHLARRIVGIDWRWSLLGAGLLGSTLLLFADFLAQRLIAGEDIEVGIITAILGAPFLLVLLRHD